MSIPRKRGGGAAWWLLAGALVGCAGAPDPGASVVRLGVHGDPTVYRAPEIVAESDIFVRPLRVRIEVGSPELEVRYTLDGSEPERWATGTSCPTSARSTRRTHGR